MAKGKVLVFALDADGDVLEIHADEEGLRLLQKDISTLLSERDTHTHLMTPSWGGDELTEKPHDPTYRVIQKVTIRRYKSGFHDDMEAPE